MKKKLLVLLIAAIPMLMPNLAFACAGQPNGTPCGTNGQCIDGTCITS